MACVQRCRRLLVLPEPGSLQGSIPVAEEFCAHDLAASEGVDPVGELADLDPALFTSAEFPNDHKNAIPCVDDVLDLEPVLSPPPDPGLNPDFDASGSAEDAALGPGGGNVELNVVV